MKPWPRKGFLLALWLAAVWACLNPRPEDFPSGAGVSGPLDPGVPGPAAEPEDGVGLNGSEAPPVVSEPPGSLTPSVGAAPDAGTQTQPAEIPDAALDGAIESPEPAATTPGTAPD